MAGWREHEGVMVALPIENVDTDQLIPARFMSAPRSKGYGGFLLHDLRRDADGALRGDMPLNRHADASLIVTRRNFGCGSSREAAVYALVDAGIRAVIAPSFGDIFAGNAVNNGLLPARVTEADAEDLIARIGAEVPAARIDLETCTITLGDRDVPFELDPVQRTKLMNGWDDIDLTRAELDKIARYRAERRKTAPWAWPVAE